MKVCVLYSGGKDSNYALHWAILHGFDVKCLVTFKPEREDSYMFHYPCIDVTDLQSKALEIPLIKFRTCGVKDRELIDLKNGLEKVKEMYNIDGVVTGALLSDYQRMNIAIICEELGLKTYCPLWRKDQAEYMRDLVRSGFKIIITAISVYGLPISLLGKELTEEDVELIIEKADEYGYNPAFEGGEAETIVVDAPLFKKRILLKKYTIVKESLYSARIEVQEMELVDK
ncbi:MAG: diphthine--ammonia ligase [Crenarchaeota archaeon]|nr:diphthine--ammonia ligase [Thermoproteota archaeon]